MDAVSTTAPSPPIAREAKEQVRVKSPYIVNPVYDGIFFIFSPLLGLLIGILIAGSRLSQDHVALWGHSAPITNIFIGSFITAHLVIVFFRSHANQNIFKLHPIRFTVVPVALLAAILISTWIFVIVAVLAIWWDVYHSSLQTFGLGRIYDARKGNEPNVGRRLDWILNLLLYAGPILAGASLVDHVDSFDEFSQVGSVFLTSIPAYAQSHQRWLTRGILAVGIPFLAFYLYSYWRLYKAGYQISFQKVFLYVATAVTSIWTWGFNSFGEAFFIMNFFHALQYFALVWWSEQKTMLKLFRLGNIRWGKPIALGLFLLLGFGYGLWAEVSHKESKFVLSTVLVVSIMHFWYDGFIWSVRKKQV
jgi:hypothetical protein